MKVDGPRPMAGAIVALAGLAVAVVLGRLVPEHAAAVSGGVTGGFGIPAAALVSGGVPDGRLPVFLGALVAYGVAAAFVARI